MTLLIVSSHEINLIFVYHIIINFTVLTNTENRYTVKIAKRENSEAIYYATESSKSCHRTWFGSGRAFNMRLYDRSDQEAMMFKRHLGCGYCTFCCKLQVICTHISTNSYKINILIILYMVLFVLFHIIVDTKTFLAFRNLDSTRRSGGNCSSTMEAFKDMF